MTARGTIINGTVSSYVVSQADTNNEIGSITLKKGTYIITGVVVCATGNKYFGVDIGGVALYGSAPSYNGNNRASGTVMMKINNDNTVVKLQSYTIEANVPLIGTFLQAIKIS